MHTHYDLIVIGAGPAGTPAALAAAQFGKKVLLIDKREAPGGECLFEGCIPSKVLENAANTYFDVISSQKFHITLDTPAQIHWEDVLKDKEEIIKHRSMGAMRQIDKLTTLEYQQGSVSFVDTHTLRVNEKLLNFNNALIATGAKTAYPSIKGNGVNKVWTNRDLFFEQKLPDEILFIGAGAISCELAQMLNKLGVKTHILERGGRILKHISKDGALLVQKRMVERGIGLDFNVNLECIAYENGSFSVTYTQDDRVETLVYKNVLMATGRVANVEGLKLENAKVEYDRKGVRVNEKLQTSQQHIYACGDVIDTPKFAHTASYEAGVVIHNMFAPSPHIVNYEKNSWVLFSDPQIAIVGLDEQRAKEKELEVTVEIYSYAQDARAQLDKATEGFLKFIIDTKTNVVIGIEIVNEDAASIIGEASLIVANEMNIMDIMKAIHPHPTLTEGFSKLAQQIFFKSMMQ